MPGGLCRRVDFFATLLFVCFSWLEVNECGPVFSNCYLRGSGQRRGKAWSGNQLGRL